MVSVDGIGALLHQIGVGVAEGIGKATAAKPSREPSAFFGQKTRGVFVAHGVVKVYFLVGNVVVAHHDEFGALLA